LNQRPMDNLYFHEANFRESNLQSTALPTELPTGYIYM
jgi:hypothetical protein